MAVRQSEVGLVGVAVGPDGLRLLLLGDDVDGILADLTGRLAGEQVTAAGDDDPAVAAALDAVDGRGPLPPLDLRGTPFQLDVWRALLGVPAGTTVSYAQLAVAAGHPRAVRAVGTACGANPVSVLVPCHRVVRSDGGIGGYGWGLAKKRTLLHREGAAASW